jgi:dolichol-phosphate mannosyltransferase
MKMDHSAGWWALLRSFKRSADRRFGSFSRLAQFCAVGTSGAVIDLGIYAILQRSFEGTGLESHLISARGVSLADIIAGTVSVFIALIWNFNLNRRFTFNDARREGGIFRQFLAYAASNALAIAISLTFRFGLPAWSEFFRQHLHSAALIGIVVATGLSFSLARWIVFRRKESTPPLPV